MAYVRPPTPLEMNPNSPLMTDAVVFPFGTGVSQSFGRLTTPWVLGSGAANGDKLISIAAGATFNNRVSISNNSALYNTTTWTRVIVFKLPTALNSQARTIFASSDVDTGSGYVNGSLWVYAASAADGVTSLNIVRANQATLLTVAAAPFVAGGLNTLVLSRNTDTTIGVALNGVDMGTAAASTFSWATEMFGREDRRDAPTRGDYELHWYAQSPTYVANADRVLLSNEPTMMVREVGTAGYGGGGPADTTPPTLATVGTNSSGSKIFLTANETLLASSVPATTAFTITGGHSVTAVTVSADQVSLTVNPAIAVGEALNISYVASSTGLKDSAGNQLPSFTNQLVVNNVGAGFWRFLGNEAAVVTVPANSLVRYGVTGAYVEVTIGGQITINNTTFGSDPAPGSAKHADIFISTPATGYTVTGPTLGPVGTSGLFTAMVDGIVADDLIITPTGAGLTFSPSSVVLNNEQPQATFSAVSSAPGSFTIALANNKGFTNPAALPYQAVNSILKTFGTAGADYPGLTEAIAYGNTIDPALSKVMVVLEGITDIASVSAIAAPVSANESYYMLIRARPSLSFAALNSGGAVHEGMSGLTLNIPAGSQLQMRGGVVLEGFKVNITVADGLKAPAAGPAKHALVRRCFILCNANNAVGNVAYKGSKYEDCIFIRTSALTGKYASFAWSPHIIRCTWINKSGGTVGIVHDGGWNNGAIIQDSAYSGFGANPIDGIGGFIRSGNVINSALTDATGFTVDTANAMFVGAANYRAGPALIAKAGINAKSINDILGNNRGTTPDAGAAQAVAATPLAVGTMTSQPVPDGSRVAVYFSYTGTVTSATAMLNPTVSSPYPGVPRGPLDVTFGAGTGQIIIDDVAPGFYDAPAVSLVNAGGPALVSGTIPFEINGVGGGPVDPGTTAVATAVVLTGPASGITGQVSGAFTVALNGSHAGTVRVTPDDNAGGGSFNPAFVDLTGGASGNFTYTAASGGPKSIGVVNNASLTNPTDVIYTASSPTVLVNKIVLPLTTDGTTPVADMTGLQYAWFDQALPQNLAAPTLKGIDGEIVGGTFELLLEGSALQPSQIGTLLLSTTNGDPLQNPAALVFSGPVRVQ